MTQLAERLDPFLSSLFPEETDATGLSAADRDALRTYLGEVRIGLDLVAPFLRPGQRILEIGSGIGALGHFLAGQGLDIRGIEPSGSGFDLMDRLARHVSEVAGPTGYTVADRAAEDLDPARDGPFDLIFSVHVLEHVGNLDAAFCAMEGVLKPGGKMVHLCPNYRFPYDPHFGVPLLFWSPAMTHALHARRIDAHKGIWDSLNFIGAGRLKRLARAQGLSVDFHRGVMADTFRRLNDDPVFRQRHSGLAGRVASSLTRSPLFKLVEAWPRQWASPMAVTLGKPE
tara:strand:+ start:1915 stop:2769 length:855 start_codon:yes stop_codon:yes gene_type:complete